MTEILPQLQKLLEIKAKPAFQHHIFWRRVISQYTVGYEKIVKNDGWKLIAL
jgi:protoporphyrinogen oxidase